MGLAGLAAGVGIHALIRQHQIQTLQKKAHGGFQEVYEPLAQQYIDSDSIRTEHIDSNPSTTGPSTSGPTEDLMGDDLIQTMDTTESPESGAASAESVPTE